MFLSEGTGSRMKVQIDKKKCTGCHLCEMVCSLFHLQVINPLKSAIRIAKDDLGASIHTPRVCRQCRKMKCLEKEDVDEASERNKFVWGRRRAEDCPFDGLTVSGDSAFHCDLCGGDPQCVSVCTTGAIAVKQ